ncbi:regulatory protein GemA [uncultured Novosphingobium sp.]|uniref:regulatory protein GemA n=1 Tax=uncultured Novosphingobium sp. TaxID=292277 RepID=UPI00259847A7|nr:regulatory protein GemA [uncultured Novosphingobium sp.]
MLKVAVDNAHRAEGSSQRHKLLATVHIARKQLAMQDDDYAALLERVTGKRSAADCSDGQLRDAIREFEAKGFRSSSGRSKRRIVGGGETVRKARAMWISLYQLGAIRDGSDAALEALGRRQLKVDRLVWANERHANRLIEALKAMTNSPNLDVPALASQSLSVCSPAVDRITDEERAVCTALGLGEDQFMAQKRRGADDALCAQSASGLSAEEQRIIELLGMSEADFIAARELTGSNG